MPPQLPCAGDQIAALAVGAARPWAILGLQPKYLRRTMRPPISSRYRWTSIVP